MRFLFFSILILFSKLSFAQNKIFVQPTQSTLENCKMVKNDSMELNLTSGEFSDGKLTLQQGPLRVCYGVSVLTSMQFEINKNLITSGKKPVIFSISDALRKGSSYSDRGDGIAFFLNIMLGNREICLKEDALLSHEEFCEILLGNKVTCAKGSKKDQFVTFLRKTRKMEIKKGRLNKFLVTVTNLMNKKEMCLTPYHLPFMQMKTYSYQNKDKILERIKKIILNNHIATISTENHQTNVVGFQTYSCKEGPLTLFKILDPQGILKYFLADPFLEEISKYGEINFVKILPEIHNDSRPLIGKNALIYASAIDPIKVPFYQSYINELIDNNLNINQSSINGWTPFHKAASNGHIQMASLLLSKGALINQTMNDGATPLYLAAEKGNVGMIRYLLDNGANINQAMNVGSTPLFIAVYYGHYNAVKFLLDRGANINQSMTNGTTPLFVAVQKLHYEIVELLLIRGADKHLARKDGETPYSYAIKTYDYKMAKLINP